MYLTKVIVKITADQLEANINSFLSSVKDIELIDIKLDVKDDKYIALIIYKRSDKSLNEYPYYRGYTTKEVW